MSSANNKGRMSRRKKMEPWYYVGPIFLLLVIMFGYPLIKSVVMAFQNYKLGNANVYFNDFANFHKMFGDKDFLLLLKNSVVYVVVSVFGQFIGGLILALCLRDKFKGRGIYQSIVFLPWAFSAFVVGLVFRWSFNGEYGVVNDVLMKLGIIKKGIAWLGTPGLSLVVVILAMIWIGIPFFGIMILAALQSIPDEIYEAADMDGCGMFRKFFSLTLPYIKPTVIMTILLRTIWIFNSFDLVVIVTQGGPANYSQTLPSYMYTKAFSGYDFGLAGAFGVLLMVILGVYAILFLKLSNYDKAGDF
ncbi:carbohydrate ABC transporter permease [Blautia obeum]|uniref:carbohydrate ABC transporter permease n=1 Tax=Blautia obeum TaxID=40520 RepID=UPI0022E16C5A|nr:sugar ABC transporter permease [Blautia obeum]